REESDGGYKLVELIRRWRRVCSHRRARAGRCLLPAAVQPHRAEHERNTEEDRYRLRTVCHLLTPARNATPSFEWGVLSILILVGRRLKRCSRLAFDCLRVGGNPPTTGKTSDVYFSAEQLMSEKGQLFAFESVCRQTGSNSKNGPTPSAARHQHTHVPCA